MPIPLRLEYVIEHLARDFVQRHGAPAAPVEAALWDDVMRHKWLLSERAGRDVGLRVAALDYIENVRGRQASA